MVALSSRVAPVQRFTRHSPCPVCGGWQGHGCWGFYSDDGRYAFCTAEVFAGALDLHSTAQAYKHLLAGACRCGVEHGGALDPSDLYERIPEAATPKRSHHQKPPTAIYATYDNPDTRKLRYGTGKGKYFVWQRADGQGDWLNGLNGQMPGLYNGPALATADPFTPVYVTEGEGDAERILAAGGMAVSPSGGADSWEEEYSERLRGFLVVVCGDRDESGKGQAHAQHVAESLAAHGAVARLLFFDEAHDVGDWIKAGHSFAELRALAATAPIITAQSLESENSSLALKLGNTAPAPKSCPQCAMLRDQLKRAEESLGRVRERINWHHRIMRLPKEKLAPALKPAAIAAYDLLKSPKLRDEHGHEQVYRRTIAKRCGTSDKTAGTHLRALHEAGIIHREVKSLGFHESEIRISEGPLFATPEQIAERELAKRHGGKREHCSACGSENLETHIHCRACGNVMNYGDTNPPAKNTSLAPELEQPVDDAETAEAMLDNEALPQPSDSLSSQTLLVVSDVRATGDPRADLLTLARALDWPALRLARPFAHISIPAGDYAWHAFTRSGAPDAQLRAALEALEALAKTDRAS